MEIVGAVTLVTSATVILGVALAWGRMSTPVGDAIVAAAGAGMAVGALLLMEDPAVSAWAIAPPVVAVLSVLHVRLLVAPGGPLRT
jgi:hypothetical protein